VWCGPCKRMAATTFVDPGVAEFYNKNFINVKIDGEKNDGPGIMQKYGISAFPTLLYLAADGSLLRKTVGMADVASVMKRGNEVLHPEATELYKARKKYYASQRMLPDLHDYLNVMIADDSDSLSHFTWTYYTIQKQLNLADPIELYVFYKHENDLNSALSNQFLENPASFSPDTYTGKIKEWINFSFGQAVQQGNFALVEATINKVYPYWEKAEHLQQDKAAYLSYVQSQYAKYRPQ